MIAPGYHRAVAVVPSDTVNQNFGFTQKALYVGGGGNLRVITSGGDDITLTAVPIGMLFLTVKRVWTTGTTATLVIAIGD